MTAREVGFASCIVNAIKAVTIRDARGADFMHREWLRGLIVFALLMVGFALKGALIDPPSPPAQAAPNEFNTQRAVARLQRILGEERPHPVDTAANDAVRGRLMEELRAIGLDPQVHEAMDCSGFPKLRVVSCSHVRNVVATVPGRGPGKHLLMNAHYDSTPTGPGASDDGLGVAAMLEIAQLLKQSQPARPVTLLFNEGEEYGLNGAAAFVRTDPLAKQVNSLVNIDTRGVTGPALMHETSAPNGAAIAAYGRASLRPYANSISTDFAKLIPNTTDVVKFAPAGWTLLNWGIIGNETRYHSPGDTVPALDRASVYHVGSEVYAATRALSDMPDPARPGMGRMVFTSIAGHAFIRIPLLIAVIDLGLLLLIGGFLARRARALGKPLLTSAAMVFGGIAAAALLSVAAGLIRAGDYFRAYPLVSYLAVYATLLAAMLTIWSRWEHGLDRERMRAAAWLFILILGAALSLALPGATIFFLIAPTIALIGVALPSRSPTTATALAIAAILIQFLMFAELLALVEMLLIDGPLWAVAPLAALAALPAIVEVDADRVRTLRLPLLMAAASLWIAALIVPRSSAERPQAFTIDYFRDADHKTASWGIASKQAPLPALFGGAWRKGELPYNGRTRWIAKAPLLDTPAPSAFVISNEPTGRGRRVQLQLSPGAADAISIRFPEKAKLLAIGLPGGPVPIPAEGEPDKAALRCAGRSCNGLVIEAVLGNRAPIVAELFATRYALPPQGAALQAARPANAIPQYSPDATITLTRIKL